MVDTAVDSKFMAGLRGLKTVGRYEIVRKLGRGGMAVVYLGWDPYIKRNVAIKMSVPGSEKAREQFFVEAQSVGRMAHPGIVGVYDAGIHGDYCYMAIEYVDGDTMEQFCDAEHLLPLNKAVQMMFTTANALNYAHEQGILHRDIKPSNIMLTANEQPKIADFGVAQILEQTTISGFFGTPRYMSPEKIKGEDISFNSDLWSLGCILYMLFTGRHAFPGKKLSEVRKNIINAEPMPVTRVRSDVPDILEEIIARALHKDPRKRYQSCLEFAYDLRVALRGLSQGEETDEKAKNAIEYIHKVPFFRNFKQDQVEKLFSASSLEKASVGEVIVAEGEIDDCFYVILSGEAKIIKAGEDIATIGVGECFGEMAYIGGQARVASVVAVTDMVVMKISATLLDRAPGPIQLIFFKNFSMLLVRRLSSFFKMP